jgi:hypothetical protein
MAGGGGGGGGDQTVESKPWEGVRDHLVRLYERAAAQSEGSNMIPLQALPIDQRMQQVAQMWGTQNPAEIAGAYGFQGGLLEGGALDGPPVGNTPPPVPDLSPDPQPQPQPQPPPTNVTDPGRMVANMQLREWRPMSGAYNEEEGYGLIRNRETGQLQNIPRMRQATPLNPWGAPR